MADTLAIRRRIKSVASTRQITKALQLVSASKLRAAVVAATGAEAYRQRLDQVLAAVAASQDWQSHPLLRRPATDVTHVVVIGSDRGLAGAYHTRLEALLNQVVAEEQAAGRRVEATSIGRVPATMVARLDSVTSINHFAGLNVLPTIWEVYPIVRQLVQRFEEGKISALKVITTRYISALRQQAELHPLLPLATPETAATGPAGTRVVPPTLEPDPETAITTAVYNWLQAAMLDAATTAVASEHAMRMMAMQNATNNAGDLIEDLTLEYNTARQAAITQELAEISGGVAAIT